VTLCKDLAQVRAGSRREALAALSHAVLALMDWLGMRNVSEHMRVFNAFPMLALNFSLGS